MPTKYTTLDHEASRHERKYSPANLVMLNVGFAQERGTWNYRNVCSPFTRLYYVTKGSAALILNGVEHTLTPGHMYMVPALTPHSNINTGVFDHYYIHILEELPPGENLFERYDLPVEIEGSRDDLRLFERLWKRNADMRLSHPNPSVYDNRHSLMECVRQSRERSLHERLFSAGALLQLLSRFVERATPKYEFSDSRVRSALDFINDHYKEEFSIDEVAEIACLSTDHFIRLFRAEVGISPRQYVINLRLSRAKVLFSTESMPISEVAMEVGYTDPSYFTRLFRRHTSFTPQQYRDTFNT